MHPEIHAAQPGNCPKCGMKLIKEKPKAVAKPVIKKTAPNANGRSTGLTLFRQQQVPFIPQK